MDGPLNTVLAQVGVSIACHSLRKRLGFTPSAGTKRHFTPDGDGLRLPENACSAPIAIGRRLFALNVDGRSKRKQIPVEHAQDLISQFVLI